MNYEIEKLSKREHTPKPARFSSVFNIVYLLSKKYSKYEG